MDTKFFIFLTFLTSFLISAQNYSEDDVFERTKDDYMIIKPSVDKSIKAKIKPIIEKKINDLIEHSKNEYSTLSAKEIEYAKDTLTISEYINEYNNYQASSSTFGMNRAIQFSNWEYDKLLNKYYKSALEMLKPEMKKQLINSQKKWLDYYNSERVFINNLQDFGNHNFLVYASGYSDKILIDRVQFLVDIYQEKMQGSSTYKEN